MAHRESAPHGIAVRIGNEPSGIATPRSAMVSKHRYPAAEDSTGSGGLKRLCGPATDVRRACATQPS
jgi:hypothetical protein